MRSAQQMARSWKENAGSAAAQQKYKESIDSLQVSPTEQAATEQAMENYVRGVQASVTSGRRRERLMAVSLASYKAITKAKAGRMVDGVNAALPKVEAALAKFQPVYQAIKDAVRALPKGGESNATQRMLLARRMLRQAAGKPQD